MCKEAGRVLAEERHVSVMPNPVAVELGLDDPNGPAAVLASMGWVQGETATSVNVVYMYLLEACEKMFSGELDVAVFEEHARWFFGTKVGIERTNFTFGEIDGYSSTRRTIYLRWTN
jgi:paired amphipathic helix protein Sin3a